jgi:protein phosphatase
VTLVLRYIARSDRGLVRSNNEDSVYAGARLLALADGMGGHAAGEVASQLVIEALQPLDDDEPGGDLLGKLESAIASGNAAIADQVERSPELDGMGTTLTAILFAGNRLALCHIGDSRGYLLRDGELNQITRDDTFVQTLVEEGRITAEQAHTHPQRSLIMRALTGAEVEPTLTIREARAGDRYLLCSDGLSDVVSEETIADTLSSVADHGDCADRLIELALRGGGPDNVTVVVADVVDVDYGDHRPIRAGAAGEGDDDYVPDPKTSAGRAAALRPPQESPRRPTVDVEDVVEERRPRRRWLWAAIAIVLIVLVVAGGFVARSIIRSNYYVGEHDGEVVLYQGMQGSILGISLNSVSLAACVSDPSAATPTISFADAGSSSCSPLRVADLSQPSQNTVRASKPSVPLDEAKQNVTLLSLLPLCGEQSTPTTSVPPSSATPAPSSTPSPPPATTVPGQPAPPPASSAAPSPTVDTSVDRFDDSGRKICRGH